MPIYVYEPTIYSDQEQVNDCCSFEILQSMGEKPLAHCPTCGHAIHKAVTAFNVKESNFEKKKDALNSFGESGSSASTSAKNAARLAARHVCGGGCSH